MDTRGRLIDNVLEGSRGNFGVHEEHIRCKDPLHREDAPATRLPIARRTTATAKRLWKGSVLASAGD